MDNNFLRMIANPYLLKKNNNNKIIINNDDILCKYIKTIYPKTYIPPKVINEISNQINNTIIKYQVEKFVDQIIQNCLNKFD